jgi:hypothetical protein
LAHFGCAENPSSIPKRTECCKWIEICSNDFWFFRVVPRAYYGATCYFARVPHLYIVGWRSYYLRNYSSLVTSQVVNLTKPDALGTWERGDIPILL